MKKLIVLIAAICVLFLGCPNPAGRTGGGGGRGAGNGGGGNSRGGLTLDDDGGFVVEIIDDDDNGGGGGDNGGGTPPNIDLPPALTEDDVEDSTDVGSGKTGDGKFSGKEFNVNNNGSFTGTTYNPYGITAYSYRKNMVYVKVNPEFFTYYESFTVTVKADSAGYIDYVITADGWLVDGFYVFSIGPRQYQKGWVHSFKLIEE